MLTRRTLLGTFGGALTLPLLESAVSATPTVVRKGRPTRFLVAGNPFGAHPDNFFPKEFGTDYKFPRTLRSLEWLGDRLSIFSHTDHNMVSGHGREISFLSGVLPADAQAFPEKNMSLDQLLARVGDYHRANRLVVTVGASVDP